MVVMLYKKILLIIIFLNPISLFAQDSLYRSSVSFALGPSYPYGKFKSTDINKNTSAYAVQGLNLLFNLDYQLRKNWGLNINLFSYYNDFDIAGVENYYNNHSEFGETYKVEKIDSGWNMFSFTLGATFQGSFDKKNRFCYKTKFAIGPGTGYSPSYTLVRTETNGAVTRLKKESSSGEVFFLNLGIYNSIETGCVFAKRIYAYLYAAHLLKSEGLQDPFLNNGYSFNFSTINCGAGLAYKFGMGVVKPRNTSAKNKLLN